MNRLICHIEILGTTFELRWTDEQEFLMEEGDSSPSHGLYNLNQATIYLNADLSLRNAPGLLFHEIYEATLALTRASYSPFNPHRCFSNFSDILFSVFKANHAVLFTGKLVELIESGYDKTHAKP